MRKFKKYVVTLKKISRFFNVTLMDTPTPASRRRPFTFDRVVRMVLLALGLCAVLWLIHRLSSVLLPFAVSWLIAYMLEPMVIRNQKALHLKGRFIPIMLTLVEVAMVLSLLIAFFLPSFVSEMHQVAELAKGYAADKGGTVAFIPSSVHEFLRENIDFETIADQLTSSDYKSLASMAISFVSGGLNFILGLVNWCLVVLYVIFIMLDYEKLLAGFRHLVPPQYRVQTFAIMRDVTDSMNHYFRGQSLVAIIVGVLFSIGFAIVGLPLGILLGLLIGLMNMVPYLQLVSIPVTTLLCLIYSVESSVSFWPVWWECMAVYVVVQCIQDLLLTPKIMGKAMGLNPAVILLSLSVWGSLLGFIGLIIALPLTTLLLAYYDRYIIHKIHLK